jgi:hypothetical protein
MSTRDEMRRELRDLAKLASVLPKEHQSAPPPPLPAEAGSSSRVTVPPAIRTVPPPRAKAQPAPSKLLPDVRPPPRAGQALVRPGSVPPPTAVQVSGSETPSWRGGWFILAGATLAAAMFGGLALGQVLTSKASPSSMHPASAPPAVAARQHVAAPSLQVSPPPTAAAPPAAAEPAARAAEAPAAAPPPDVPTQTPTRMAPPLDLDAVPAVSATVLTITGACPPAVVIRTPRLPHRPAGAPTPRASTAMSTVASGGVGSAKVSARAAGGSRGRDSLDDLIRRAAGGN